jgi:hypothetical protein
MYENNKDNLIVYVSSRNNYDMLEAEVLNNINTEGFEFINVDDNSSIKEIEKGKAICSRHNITFLENKSRGVQMATQTLIDYLRENRPRCKWIFCFQHDIYPISKNFFTSISELINQNKLDSFGIIGFNVLDDGDYTNNALEEYNKGNQPLGMIGMAHLSIKSQTGRWLCPKQQSTLLKSSPAWTKPFIVEFPMWAAVGINVKLWNEKIIPTDQYHFHLWLPDIAMQFNYHNYGCLILPDHYCLNNQNLKSKYNINPNSATGAKEGDTYHFGEYSNFKVWKERWGWSYETVTEGFEDIKVNYKNTLIGDFYDHKIDKGPLKSINLI